MIYGITDMNDYEEIMNGLVKLREYCKKQIVDGCCNECKFGAFCDVNLFDTNPCPKTWVFGDEEIICDEE